MNSSTPCLTLAALLFASAPTRAGIPQISAGVACQPATAADVPRLDYGTGSARNLFAPPGSAGQVATVVCALPTVAPGHVMVRASVFVHDPARRWPRAKCTFLNAAPGVTPHWAPILALSSTSVIGSATIDVDPFAFVPHAVNCSVHPGQSVYSIQTEVEPLG